MRRIACVGAVVLALFAAAAVGLAAHQAPSTKSVSATFAVTPSTQNRVTTCTGADGDYTRIDGSYAGTSASADARLAGAIKIKGQSLVNKTTGLGWMRGTVRIDTSSDEDTKANLTAVISGGQLNGFLNGRVHDASGNLLGGFSAAFGATGITGGSIGSTSSTPALVLTGSCHRGKKEKENK